MATWHFHFAAPRQSLLGENRSQGSNTCRGSLCSPTQSTYVAFTHMLLPGTSRRRGVVPPSLPRHHRLLLMCQQTWESSGYPADSHSHLPRICGPTQRGIRFIGKSRNYKYEPKQENEARVCLKRNSKPCPLLWARAHSGLSPCLSTLATMESTSHLLSTQPFPAEIEGTQVFSCWLWCASLMPVLPTVQSHWEKNNKNKQPKNWTMGWDSIPNPLKM